MAVDVSIEGVWYAVTNTVKWSVRTTVGRSGDGTNVWAAIKDSVEEAILDAVERNIRAPLHDMYVNGNPECAWRE